MSIVKSNSFITKFCTLYLYYVLFILATDLTVQLVAIFLMTNFAKTVLIIVERFSTYHVFITHSTLSTLSNFPFWLSLKYYVAMDRLQDRFFLYSAVVVW